MQLHFFTFGFCIMNKLITIKPNIHFITDLGYMFFDDGSKTIRLTRANFSRAQHEELIAEALIVDNPDFFEFVDNNHLAEMRLVDGLSLIHI